MSINTAVFAAVALAGGLVFAAKALVPTAADKSEVALFTAKPAGSESTVPLFEAEELRQRSAKVATEDRNRYVDMCGRKLRTAPLSGRVVSAAASGSGSVRGTKHKLQEKLDPLIERLCECLVNGIEDRSNAVEYKLAMATIERARVDHWVMSRHDLPEFRQPALAHGVSEANYRSATYETLKTFRMTYEARQMRLRL